MATVQYERESPYSQTPRLADKTDFKHMRHLERSGGAESLLEKTKEVLNVALFGAGRAGLIHLKNIQSNPYLNLKYLMEEDDEKAKMQQALNSLPDSALINPKDIDIILQDKSIHGVIIATPTSTHEDLVIKCLESGKAVLCEKPIGVNLDGTIKCYSVAKKVGQPLLCAFNRRFDPTFREIYNQVRSGKVGRVHMIKSVARDSPVPPISYMKISGGIFHDCAVHDIDLICNILGEYPNKVLAAASAFIPEIEKLNDFDTVAITLKFPSGTIGMIDLSRNSVYGYDQRLEVFGSEGMVQAGNEVPVQTLYSGVAGASRPPICYSFPSRYFESYNMELEHFIDLMRGESKLEVTFENTLKISKIASALEKSIETEAFVNV